MDRNRQRLAASFQADARQYAQSRPVYPPAAVDWMAGPPRRRVLDLAAGTGSLTRPLAGAGHSVVACDVSASMLAELTTGDGVPRVRCPAEALPFGDRSFDVVTVGTAFHWFDATAALPEIARVLGGGGVLALAWNIRKETTSFTRRLGQLLLSAQPAPRYDDWAVSSVTAVEESPLFGSLEYAEFPHDQRLSRDGVVGLVASRSYVIALPADRRARLLDDVRRLFDEEAASAGSASGRQHTVLLPYRTQCWRARLAE